MRIGIGKGREEQCCIVNSEDAGRAMYQGVQPQPEDRADKTLPSFLPKSFQQDHSPEKLLSISQGLYCFKPLNL